MAGMADMVGSALYLGTPWGYTMVPPTPGLPHQKKFWLKKIRINVSVEIENDWYFLDG